MSDTIIVFNNHRYSLTKMRAIAGSAPQVTVKIEELAPEAAIDVNHDSQLKAAIIVVQHEGKYVILDGVRKAQEQITQPGNQTLPARLLSKVALKKASLDVVYEHPAPPAPVRAYSDRPTYPKSRTYSTYRSK